MKRSSQKRQFEDGFQKLQFPLVWRKSQGYVGAEWPAENAFSMRKSFKSRFSVVVSNTAIADAAKGKVRICHMKYRVI
jgi:hypothetical protein